MALQSSGQIKLSEIATEFGGTAPHALSEYYGEGNAPASGEIQLAADFYGTSSVTYLVNGTLTAGQVTDKSNYVMRGYDPSTPSSNASIGSVSLSTNTGSLSHMVDTIDSGPANGPHVTFHTYMTSAAARADTHKIIVGNTTLNRRSLEITRQPLQHQNGGGLEGWERYTPSGIIDSSNIGFVNGTTYTIKIVKMADDETWLDTTMTVAHWVNVDIKAANVNHRGFSGDGAGTVGFNSFNSGGSIASNVLTNPDTGQASGYTLNNVFGNASTANATSTSTIGITGTDNSLQSNRFRGVLLTKSGGSQLWVSFDDDNSSSTVIPSGATVVTPNQSGTTYIRRQNDTTLYNFLSTSGEQINVKVY